MKSKYKIGDIIELRGSIGIIIGLTLRKKDSKPCYIMRWFLGKLHDIKSGDCIDPFDNYDEQYNKIGYCGKLIDYLMVGKL